MEKWKTIGGYEGLYEVSNQGRVKSLERVDCRGRKRKERVLKPQKLRTNHLLVCLYKNGLGKQFLVHRLVAQAFIENPDNLPEVNHRDENPSNNSAENLEWCTPKYNTNYGTGIQRMREKQLNSPSKSKCVYQYSIAGEFIREWPSTISVQRELGFSFGNIANCCRGIRNTAYGFKWCYSS